MQLGARITHAPRRLRRHLIHHPSPLPPPPTLPPTNVHQSTAGPQKHGRHLLRRNHARAPQLLVQPPSYKHCHHIPQHRPHPIHPPLGIHQICAPHPPPPTRVCRWTWAGYRPRSRRRTRRWSSRRRRWARWTRVCGECAGLVGCGGRRGVRMGWAGRAGRADRAGWAVEGVREDAVVLGCRNQEAADDERERGQGAAARERCVGPGGWGWRGGVWEGLGSVRGGVRVAQR
jgi:hypothetical protein